MKIKLTKTIIFIMIFIFVLIFLQTAGLTGNVRASSDKIHPDDYDTKVKYDDAPYIFSKGAKILKIFRNIAAIVAVLVLSIIGVRYMVGSVEQKAEYKQTMIPVIIGCILIAFLSTILTVISSIFK